MWNKKPKVNEVNIVTVFEIPVSKVNPKNVNIIIVNDGGTNRIDIIFANFEEEISLPLLKY